MQQRQCVWFIASVKLADWRFDFELLLFAYISIEIEIDCIGLALVDRHD